MIRILAFYFVLPVIFFASNLYAQTEVQNSYEDKITIISSSG